MFFRQFSGFNEPSKAQVMSFNAAISSCEKVGHWQMAVFLFNTMLQAEIKCYNCRGFHKKRGWVGVAEAKGSRKRDRCFDYIHRVWQRRGW